MPLVAMKKQDAIISLPANLDVDLRVFCCGVLSQDASQCQEEQEEAPRARLDYVLQEHAGEALVESYGAALFPNTN